MENRVPPPVILLLTLLLMYGVAAIDTLTSFNFGYANYLAAIFVAAGSLVIFLGVIQFIRAQTTVDPLKPSRASKLVTTGVFRFTRNPMYLGMALICIGAAWRFESVLAALGVALFIVFIQRYQIKPEERAMRALFAKEFDAYCKTTSRWI